MPGEKSGVLGWAQVGATVFLGVVGLIFTYVSNKQQNLSRDAHIAVQLMSQREQADMTLREKLFQTLVPELLKRSVPPRERLTLLRLFQHNFHDVFSGRALFDVLEADAAKNGEADVIKDLVSLAKEITRAQVSLIGVEPRDHDLAEGEWAIDTLSVEEEPEQHRRPHVVTVTLLKVRVRSVQVAARIDSMQPDTFEVSYFDAPYTDNTLLPDRHRLALTLERTDTSSHPHRATLRLIEFPAHYVTTGYRPSVKETDDMVRESH